MIFINDEISYRLIIFNYLSYCPFYFHYRNSIRVLWEAFAQTTSSNFKWLLFAPMLSLSLVRLFDLFYVIFLSIHSVSTLYFSLHFPVQHGKYRPCPLFGLNSYNHRIIIFSFDLAMWANYTQLSVTWT